MTNIAAAIGLSQLENIDSILGRKQELANLYRKILRDSHVSFQDIEEKGVSDAVH